MQRHSRKWTSVKRTSVRSYSGKRSRCNPGVPPVSIGKNSHKYSRPASQRSSSDRSKWMQQPPWKSTQGNDSINILFYIYDQCRFVHSQHFVQRDYYNIFRHLVILVLFGPVLNLVSKRTYIVHSFQYLKLDSLYLHQRKKPKYNDSVNRIHTEDQGSSTGRDRSKL